MAGPIVAFQTGRGAPARARSGNMRWQAAPAVKPTGRVSSRSHSANGAVASDKETYILPDKQPGELPKMIELTRPVFPDGARSAAARAVSVEKKTVEVINAFGNATAVTVSATKGAKARVDVDITLHILTETSVKELTKTFEQELTETEKTEIQKESSKIGGIGFFSRGFGIFGGKDTKYNENTSREYNFENNERLNRVAEAFKSTQTADVNVTGKLLVEGVSLHFPSEASILIEVLKVKIDGEEYLMISEDPVAYDSTKGEVLPPVEGGPLTITPLF